MAKPAKNHKRTTILLTKEMNERNMSAGSLLKSIGKHYALTLNVILNENNDIVSYGNKTYERITINHDDCLMFLDVVYDSRSWRHYFRFLFGDKVVGIEHKKGKTMTMLKKEFEVLHHGTPKEKKDG